MDKQRRQLTPEQDALEHILACRDKRFLEERFIDSFKGRGLFTHKAIEPSTFVVEYRGNIFSHKDTKPTKTCGYTLNNYLFEFAWEGAWWCVDASKEDRALGRCVNDDHITPNCEMKTMVYEGEPHLCLFAATEISPGEEITYNYGDSSYPWRSGVSFDGSSTSYSDFYATSSTPRPVRHEYYCFDDDDNDKELPDSGQRHGNGGFADINSQMDFMDNSTFADLDSSKEMSGTFMLQPDDASYTQQGGKAASGSRPSKATPNPKGTSRTTRSYCYICGKGVIKLSRHLLRHADEEPGIAEALALPRTKERKRLLLKLRNRGNYQHNQDVLKNNSGELKPKRRPKTTEISTKTHVHCLHCKGMFGRKEMWRHVARCPCKTTSNPATGGKIKVLSEIALADSPFSGKLSAGVWKMLLKMKQDDIATAVQKDFLLMQLAVYLCDKHENHPRKHEYIRQRLREMGRLLLALHKKSIFSIKDAIRPKNFYKVVEAVKDVTGFDEKMQSYNKPSLALRLGHSLKKMCEIVLAGVDVSDKMMRDSKTFGKLCQREWSQLVSHTALASLRGRKVSKPSTIPFTRDVQVFYRYLETTSASAIEGLEKHENPQVYNDLCRVTLAQASVLSKCASEVSKMTLETFQQRDDSIQVLSKHFIRINIQSRSGQNVAVLLTSELVAAISLLVSKRKACGVHKDNPFLFAMPNSSPTSLFHGANCIRVFSSLCRAKNPEHFRSVHLRKHIARVFQILNLENDELDHLAKLLGHDIRADRDYYRLPEAAVELAKISKLLLAMEKGSLEKFKGNSLEEIEIEDELEPDVEQGNPENRDAEVDNEESDLLLPQSEAAEQQGVQLNPEQDAVEHIKAYRDKPFLEERFIDPFKGRGVFTHESIEASTFVVEYRGNIYSLKETRKKKSGDTLNNYLFDFSWNGTSWRIDAANDDRTLGRLVNDNHINPNCEMTKVVFEGKPHLCLFAVTEISPGEEITYNYGDSSYPWRSWECSEDLNASQGDLNAAASSPEHETVDDEDYVPSTSDNDGSSFEQQPIDASFVQQEDESDYSSDNSKSDEEFKDPSITNKNYCYVCGVAQSKISRHLYTHRKQEPDIAAVLKLRKNSKERKELHEMLRNRGNNMHNQEVLKTRCGELKVRRKSSNMLTTAKTFASCLYCKNMYIRKDIWRHMQRCPAKKRHKLQSVKIKALNLVDAAESTDPQNLSPHVRKMLSTLRKDEISSEVLNDSFLLQLAQCLYSRKERNARRIQLIKHKLRQMGRLLLRLKQMSICSFEDAVKPENFSKLVEAVRELAGFNEETKSYEKPSFIKFLGNSLKKIGDINFARAWKGDAGSRTIDEADAFIKLCAKEWCYVYPVVLKDSTPTVPFIHDVQLFYRCMEKTAASAVESLTLYESPPVYAALLRVTVAQVSILNRNMAQVSEATLKSFKEREEAELHEDAAVDQPQFQQILSKTTVKIKVMSSRGQKVSVTLTPKLLAAITLLVNKREACGVHENNPFLFGIPDAPCTSFFYGQRCTVTFTARCGAKNKAILRSPFFHKHIARVFQILGLTSDELDQLAKLLGRDIPTDREYYQTLEAAGDIARISELLSALENGSLERFEGKSLEEIQIPDELEPAVKQHNPGNGDAEESESSHLMSSSPLAKRRRGRKKRQESEIKASELNDDEKNEEVNTERDDGSEQMPPSCAVNTPVGTVTRGNEDATNISFSDGDDDMNVDFDMDMDMDEDIVRNQENGEDGDRSSSPATPLTPDVTKQDNDSSDAQKKEKRPSVSDLEETMDIDTANNVEKEDQKKGEKKNKLTAAVTGMKEVKISIPKLDIEKFKAPVYISQLSSECNSVRSPVKDRSIQDDKNQCQTSSTSTDAKDKPSYAKATQMNCSHCKKSMMKGQTAYQKKGFTDVFCSKNCLFEMFPVNKPVTKTCYLCFKAISQPLDLIMAAVDIKGTMKDFCSPTCLLSFKSTVSTQTPQRLCSMCNKACTTTCQLTLNEAFHTFCSDSCLGDFRRDNIAVCEHCGTTFCHKPLKLKLEEEAKTVCSQECLDEFKEKIKTSHQCTMCQTSLPVSDMFDFKSGENIVELFCTRTCVTSYTLRPAGVDVLQAERENADRSKKIRATATIQIVSAGAMKKRSTASAANKNDAPADAKPKLIVAESWVVCSGCGKRMHRGETLYQTKSTPEVFCSAGCLSEKHPNIASVTKNCYNCFQMIMRPHSMILAPVDDSGTMKELCSATCLASVNSKRNAATPKHPPPAAAPRTHCRMCTKLCICKFSQTLDGRTQRLCSDACFINYHRINNLPVSACDVCSSIGSNARYRLKAEDGSKAICSEECLVKFKKKIETPRLCSMCQTPQRLSDMVENKNSEGVLDFFCSNRCMLVHNAQSSTVPERNSPSPDENDVKEVKPSPDENDVNEVKPSPDENEVNEVKPSPDENEVNEVKPSPDENDVKEVKPSPDENEVNEVKPSPDENEVNEVKPSPDENEVNEVKPSPDENEVNEVKPSPDENDVNEVKPSLPHLDYIKEEPIDEEYNQNLPSSISTEDIKDEPKAGQDVAKEDLKIGSVFSMTGDSSTSTSPAPAVAHLDLLASCSNCKLVLRDGETVYQRKGHADVFCSTPCLLKFYQMQPVKKTCYFCLQVISQPQDVIQAPVDNEGTMKDFCSQTCLSSSNYKRIVSTKIPLVPVASQSQCSMCSRYCISKHEVIQHDVVTKICSDPCFLRFCTMNNVSVCENCRSCCSAPLMLKMDDGSKKFCNAECVAQFKQKIKTLQPCAMCRTSHLMSYMFENKNNEDVVELFCTSSCVMASKIQAVNASGALLDCDQCGKTTLPACHLAMSNASIRNFCTLTCAMSFKEKQKDMDASTNSTGAADQSQYDFLKPAEKLPCAQCRCIIRVTPKVIQKKGKMNFVCGLACSQEFNTANNIIGKCEYCKYERIIRDVKKVDGKVCYFCSDGCKILFQDELGKQWGELCGSCAYCFSISKTLVTAKYESTNKKFCSEDCSANYNMLLCRVAQCDTCGRNRKLRQSLPMLGEVKHFCDRNCLLHFCNKKVQMFNTVSSPPRSSGTVESSPVIANVISLASALARQPSASDSSTQHVSVPDIHTKVVGHASVQTVPRELKNKAMLCTPLVHNKGVSCTTQTVDSESQTDNFVPKVIVLPVPVPMYVPLPMNMYSQYTPTPLCLPLPLPVPVFLPIPTVKSAKEEIQPDLLEGELGLKSEMKEDERKEREDGVVTEKGQRQEIHTQSDHSSNCSDDLDSDHQATFNTRDDSSSDTSFGSLSRPHSHRKTPPASPPPPPLEMRGDPQSSPGPEPAPPPSQQTAGKVHNKNKGRKLQQSSRAATEETCQREEVVSSKHPKLKSQCGIDSWKRWIQWRETQTNLVSSPALMLKEDVLRCSVSELSDSLCCFITEVKRPDGEPYSPDSLFYLCLSIQQYLFDNGRRENIFSDLTYNKFATKFTKILKSFNPSAAAGGYIHSRVEEEFLWDCKQLGAYSPLVLLNTLLFFCCKYFGFTTVEQHHQLSFAHVVRRTKTNPNNTKTTFLRFYPPISTNEAETDGVPAKKRRRDESKEDFLEMMENTENPLRCPVRLYEFYLSKCSESVRQRADLFYLHPDRRCVPNSPLWFSPTPLDDGTMEAMLIRILAVRELQGQDGGAVDRQTSGDTLFIPEEEDSEW
ncbi:uncharacterized protein LOC142965335 isoform X3 [Anarhichas minor]|uniref:uncharacterized protein LOC142965335 isoform X3 n=1 Tax=Anarhichas minor TaxID=65739 RepID=UPI003F737974